MNWWQSFRNTFAIFIKDWILSLTVESIHMQRYNIKPVLSISIDSLVQIAKYYGMGTEHSLGTLPR